MSLPLAGQTWPPVEWEPVFDQYALNDALYSADLDALHTLTSGVGPAGGTTRGDDPHTHYNNAQSPRRRGGIRGLFDSIRTWFWGSPSTAGQGRTRLHSPLAGNLATLSADVLMSEPPAFLLIDENGEPLRGQVVTEPQAPKVIPPMLAPQVPGEEPREAPPADPANPDAPAPEATIVPQPDRVVGRRPHPAQARLDEIIGSDENRAALIEAAEYCAGLGAVALTVQWDAENTDRPWLGVVACDAVIPEWEGGRLVAVNMWTTHPKLDQAGQVEATWLHIERHEIGQIVHALYLAGMDGKIRRPAAVAELDELAYLAEIPGSIAGPFDGTISLPTGIELLTASWWRNLPTRRFRKHGSLSRVGRSDVEGVEHFIDQVDMVWSSWMRDIKLARARLIVGGQLLDNGTINAPTFDDDAEILKALDFTPTNPDDPPLVAHQFEIRAQEHADTILALTKEVLQHAGYSLASYGEYGDVQKTATEISDRTTATGRTRNKKALYFKQAAAPLIEALLEIDRVHYKGPGMPADTTLDIVFAEDTMPDQQALAQTAQYLRAAMAASTKTLVRMLHPEWDNDQVDAEVQDILEENDLGGQLDPGVVGRDGDDPENPLDPENPDDDPAAGGDDPELEEEAA